MQGRRLENADRDHGARELGGPDLCDDGDEHKISQT
jgi:hypothetical protein